MTDDAKRPRKGPSRPVAVLLLVLFVVGPVLLAQVAATLFAQGGYDYAAARRSGQVTVKSCERRGPVGVLYLGYWDECTVAGRWDDGGSIYDTVGRPNVFHAGEVGRTVTVGDNGRSRSGRRQLYSRPDFPPDRVLRVVGTVIVVVDVLPLVALVFAILWTIREVLRRLLSRR